MYSAQGSAEKPKAHVKDLTKRYLRLNKIIKLLSSIHKVSTFHIPDTSCREILSSFVKMVVLV